MNTALITSSRVRGVAFALELGAIVFSVIEGVGVILTRNPYGGLAVGGYCLPFICYSVYPSTMVVVSLIALVVTIKDPLLTVPFIAFNVSFGELIFAADTFPTIFFSGYVNAWHDPSLWDIRFLMLWWACVLAMPFVLNRMGHRIRFDWMFIPYLAVCIACNFFVPYVHTNWWSLAISDSIIMWQSWIVWRMFRL